MIRDICINCKKPILLKDSRIGWIHLFNIKNCVDPKPYPYDNRSCTCEVPHYHCYSWICNCVRHEGQIHW